MCRRSPDVIGCFTLPVRFLLWLHLLGLLNSQQLPSPDSKYGYGIDLVKLFYDNNRIPDGYEVTPYLFHNATKKYFFLLKDPTDRLEFSLTPCASPIIWRVTHTITKGNKQYDFEDAVENSVRGLSSGGDKKPYLYSSSGEAAETLRLDKPKLGIYTVEVISTTSESYVQIFVTTSPEVNRFPELPVDSSINKSHVTSRGFRISWHPSPDERHFGEEIEYCVSINRKRSFQTLCSAVAHLNGDAKPTLPPGNGFGFSFDISRRKFLRQAKPIKPAKRGSIFYTCIRQEKTFVFDRIKKGRKFYVNVFVKNKQSGKSRPYKTTQIKVRRKRKVSTLKDGRSKNIVFSKRKKSRSYKFYVKQTTKDVSLAVHGCGSHLNIKVDSENMTLYNSQVSSELITLPRLPVGVYVLTLTKTSHRRQNVYVTMLSSSKGQLFPALPVDRTVAVFDYLTSCDRITVAWMGTKKKQKYCLYKTEVPLYSKAQSLSIFKRLDQCSAHRRLEKGAKKITCKKFKYRSKSNSVLAITVTGLEKGKNYIFDVFVNKGKHFTFPYGSVRTKTKHTGCYLPT